MIRPRAAGGAPEYAVRTELYFRHRPHRRSHGRVIRRAKRLEQYFAIALEAHGIRHDWIALEQPHGHRYERAGADVTASRHLLHLKPQRLKPGELVIGEVWKAAQPQGLCHEPEVL